MFIKKQLIQLSAGKMPSIYVTWNFNQTELTSSIRVCQIEASYVAAIESIPKVFWWDTEPWKVVQVNTREQETRELCGGRS